MMPRDLAVQTVHQRSRGEALVSLARRNGVTRIGQLRQAGSAKAILPHAGDCPEVVFLNTSGGLTGGDRLTYALSLGEGVMAVATTQTAERAYRAAEGAARVEVRHAVGPGGWLDWLPQETILFDGAALDRDTQIELAGGAGCLALEAVVLGRKAMGETVQRLAFADRRCISRDGRPVHMEPLWLDDRSLAAGSAVLAGARAFATLVMVSDSAADALTAVRRVLDEPGVEAGASAWNGKLAVRMLAVDGMPLRRQIVRALDVLRQRPLPRVWQN
jgi:urease accessory protein